MALAVPVSAFANGSGAGNITGVNSEGGTGKFSTTAGHSNAPACAVSGRWAINTTTPAGQGMWSTVLTAYGLNKQVTVGGTGQCDVWGDSETVAWIQIS